MKEKILALEKDFGMKSEVTDYRKEMDRMGSLGLGIFEEGVEEGNEAKAKKVALRMHKRGYDISDIADALDESVEKVEEWLGLQPA